MLIDLGTVSGEGDHNGSMGKCRPLTVHGFQPAITSRFVSAPPLDISHKNFNRHPGAPRQERADIDAVFGRGVSRNCGRGLLTKK